MRYMKKLVAGIGVGLLMSCIFTACKPSNGTDASPPTANIKGSAEKSMASAAKNGAQPSGKDNLDPLHPVVVFETSLGKITVTLDAEKVHGTVDNFLSYVNDCQYDNTIIHQIYPGVGVVAGGYGPDFVERSTHMKIRNEASEGSKNLRGTIAMVRYPDDPDSAASQFFFNVCDNPSLDFRSRTPEGYGYCVFGAVTDGMDVVDQIAKAKVHDTPEFESTPNEAILIKSVRRIR
jgi:peptidyl-prolyl cis-trans isomerase B (cyclophilin B)